MGQDGTKNLTVVLTLVWAATILYGEMFAFWVPSLWTCSWPHLRRQFQSSSINAADYAADYVKVAVIADPQLMDRTSLHLPPKSLVLEMAQFYTDLFMRRTVLASVLPFQPDFILFLGDYFDGGPILSDQEWQESLDRFKHIFNLNTLERSTNIKVYYLPGNHDIGYAAQHSYMPQVIRRYEQEFRSRNYQLKVGKVDFIAIDAQTLDGKLQGNLTSATWNFIKDFSKGDSLSSRVLLTHIPLYRPDQTSCGPYRSSPIINQRINRAAQNNEILYQNYVTEEASNYLIDLVKPALILSGHDHDQCTVSHITKHGPVREHTLGTISWQQGNLYPSFMLLSASNNTSSSEDAILTDLCFLPMQTYIYIWYLSLFIVTILALLLWPTDGIGFLHHFGTFMGCIRSLIKCNIFRVATKEKDEDEHCEYDMVWDAEGSMHLIKKAVKRPSQEPSESSPLESRGNAVMRPTAKKLITQEPDVSIEMNMQVGSDTKVLPRVSKPKTKRLIRRLVRTVRMLTVIAVVNVPLYMMLLFKDWIDK